MQLTVCWRSPAWLRSLFFRVSSILFLDSPNSKSGKKVEATATWDLVVEKSVLTDEKVELLPEEGPIAEVRTKLLKVTQKSSPNASPLMLAKRHGFDKAQLVAGELERTSNT